MTQRSATGEWPAPAGTEPARYTVKVLPTWSFCCGSITHTGATTSAGGAWRSTPPVSAPHSRGAGLPSTNSRTPSLCLIEVYVETAATVYNSCCTASCGVPSRGPGPTSSRSTVTVFASMVTPCTLTPAGQSER